MNLRHNCHDIAHAPAAVSGKKKIGQKWEEERKKVLAAEEEERRRKNREKIEQDLATRDS